MDSRRISQNLESWEIQTVFLGPWILSLESWIQVLRALQGTEKCKFLQRAAWRTEQAYYDAPCQDVPFSHFQWQFYQFYLMKCDMVYVKKHCLFLVLVLFFSQLSYCHLNNLSTFIFGWFGNVAVAKWDLAFLERNKTHAFKELLVPCKLHVPVETTTCPEAT